MLLFLLRHPARIPMLMLGIRSEADHRTSREVAVQTSGPTGLTDQELCEIELTTSSARTPGVLHIFPECHVLRTVSILTGELYAVIA